MQQIQINPPKQQAAASSKEFDKDCLRILKSCQYFFPAKDNLEIEPYHSTKLSTISNCFVNNRSMENTIFLCLYFLILENQLLA